VALETLLIGQQRYFERGALVLLLLAIVDWVQRVIEVMLALIHRAHPARRHRPRRGADEASRQLSDPQENQLVIARLQEPPDRRQDLPAPRRAVEGDQNACSGHHCTSLTTLSFSPRRYLLYCRFLRVGPKRGAASSPAPTSDIAYEQDTQSPAKREVWRTCGPPGSSFSGSARAAALAEPEKGNFG